MSHKYAVKEVFETVQGEGARSGSRAVFVRLAGCNLWNGRPADRAKGRGACAAWCDTDFVGGEKLTGPELLERVDAAWPRVAHEERWIVVTGGEPTLQLDLGLVHLLQDNGWSIAVETNGTVANPALAACDWVTCSPKKGGDVAINQADELKVVLPGWDFAELKELQNKLKPRYCYVQPQDPIDPGFVQVSHLTGGPRQDVDYVDNVEACLQAVKALPEWRIGIQTHKIIKMP